MMRIACMVLLLAVIAACSAAGIDNPLEFPDPRDEVIKEFLVVVQYDQDGDDSPDLVTLDSSEMPYRIVEMLGSQPGGGAVDMTPLYAGLEIDTEIASAIAAHLASNLASDGETEIEVEDSTGRQHTVRIYE